MTVHITSAIVKKRKKKGSIPDSQISLMIVKGLAIDRRSDDKELTYACSHTSCTDGSRKRFFRRITLSPPPAEVKSGRQVTDFNNWYW